MQNIFANKIEPILYNAFGEKVESRSASGLNLDPYFFFASPRGKTITSGDIEERPYQFHPWINAAAWAVIKNISSLPIRLAMIDRETGVKTFVKDEWNILNHFQRPNQFMSRSNFIQNILLYLLLPSRRKGAKDNSGGQAFVAPVKAVNKENKGKINLMKNEEFDFWLPWNDDVFQPIKADTRTGLQSFKGWRFEVNGKPNSIIDYETFELIRIYLTNPYDWLKGMSSYEPAKIAMVQDIKSDIFNTNMFENDAIPAGVLTAEDWLNPDQSKEILKRWYEEYGGPGKNRKIAVLGKQLKYQAIAQSNADMQYQEQKKDTFNKILASFGINKIALGEYEKLNFATIREGRKLLWHDTYLPIGRMMLEQMSSQWTYYINPDLIFAFDLSDIEVLKPNLEKKSKAAKTLFDMGFPAWEAARINEIPMREGIEKEYPWLIEKPPQKVSAVSPTGEEEKVYNRSVSKTDETGLKFWETWVKQILDPGEKKFISLIDRFFISQRNRMQDLVDAWLNEEEGPVTNIVRQITLRPEAFLLGIVDEDKKLMKLIRPMVKEQLLRIEDQLEGELGDLIAWNVTDQTVDVFVAARKQEMHLINTTTFKESASEIGQAIETAVAENMTPQETAKLIKESVANAMNKRRNFAKTIARTEIGIISNTARVEAFKAEGIEYHKWVTAGDEKVRESHVRQGQEGNNIVRVGETFSPTGLMHPNDANGSPGEIINCRCVTVPAKLPERSEKND